MKTTLIAVSAIVGLGLGGCASTDLPAGKTSFSFPCDGGACDIIGTGTPSTGGSNYLIQHVGERIVLRARDADQDGILDEVIVGELDLAAANQLYKDGIAMATARGKCRTVRPLPVYTLTNAEGRFVIQAIEDGLGAPLNRFFVMETSMPERVLQFVDLGADGTLDTVEGGTADVADYQDEYRAVLDQGIMVGQIFRDGVRYSVRPEESRPTASLRTHSRARDRT